MGNLKKGLVLGGLLGAGLMWLNTTQKGRETRDQMLDYAADVYSDVKHRVLTSNTWQEMSKNRYVEMVSEAVDKYALQHGLNKDIKGMVMKIVNAQWKNIQRELDKRRQ